jgi:type I restriction enzyme S subunit
MAQAIFRDWFVDFGPVRRKLEGTTDPVAIMGGLTLDPARAAELAGLFPDTLGNDDAPQDWVFTTLGEAFDVKIGRTPPRKEAEHFAPRGVGERWMSIRDMGACGAFIIATAEGLTKTAVETFRVPPIPDQTVVVSFKLTVGRVAITAGTMFSNEAIAQLRAKAGSPSPWFTYCWMKMFDYDQLGSTSSIATAVNSDSIKGMPFPKVPEGALSRFDEIVEPIFERIRASILESDTLAETRDYLLPRLMSDEVRVGELEAEVA